MKTAAGHPIIRSKLVQEGGGGGVRGHIVLCDISAENSLHPYVTWFMREEGMTTYEGDYCRTLEEALESFERRR